MLKFNFFHSGIILWCDTFLFQWKQSLMLMLVEKIKKHLVGERVERNEQYYKWNYMERNVKTMLIWQKQYHNFRFRHAMAYTKVLTSYFSLKIVLPPPLQQFSSSVGTRTNMCLVLSDLVGLPDLVFVQNSNHHMAH